MKYGACFDAKIGAEALYEVFKSIDLPTLEKDLTAAVEKKLAQLRERNLRRDCHLYVHFKMLASDQSGCSSQLYLLSRLEYVLWWR